MTINNLKLPDKNEPNRKILEARLEKLISACKVLGLNLDLVTSDVCFYVENSCGERLFLVDEQLKKLEKMYEQ